MSFCSEWDYIPSDGADMHFGSTLRSALLMNVQMPEVASACDGRHQTLVTSKLDYSKELYVGLHFKTSWKLQLMQNVTIGILISPGIGTMSSCCCQFISGHNSKDYLFFLKALNSVTKVP